MISPNSVPFDAALGGYAGAVSISIRGIRGIPHFQKHPNNWDDWNEGVNVRVNHSNWCESELKPAGMNFTPGLGFQDMYGFYIFL